MTRRELLQAGVALSASGTPVASKAAADAYEWIRTARIVIAEAYNPPFYPRYEYDPEKALRIVKSLNGAAIRFPSASYYAYFPTRTKLPVCPELNGADPLAETVEVFHKAGLKVVAYVPLIHPFMQVGSDDPNYPNWVRRFADGRPMTTGHMGFGEYYEGCINSPLRDENRELVREVLTRYPVDVIYFDGPYMGMRNRFSFCHCRYCEEAYRKARGKPVPLQSEKLTREEEQEYVLWARDEVNGAFVRELREMIRNTRDVPVLFNNSGLLARRSWFADGYRWLDGFMFEASNSPEQKLFNIQAGKSSGKVVWTYVGNYGQYAGTHARNAFGGWYSYPVEGDELLLDGAVAAAAGAGLVYWSISRFYYVEGNPRRVRGTFDFVEKYRALLSGQRPVPQAGILTSRRTIEWYQGREFVPGAYANAYYGAFQIFKDNGYDAEPFLDDALTPELLSNYRLVFAPGVACLSDAHCAALTRYVENGGTLIASHLTSSADELGHSRMRPALADLFGVRLKTAEVIDKPDLYLKPLPSGEMIPQSPQAVVVEALPGAAVLAHTYDLSDGRVIGPAVVTRNHGKGRVIYIASSLDSVYEETRMQQIRDYFGKLIAPVLEGFRTYRVQRRPGLLPHLTASQGALILYLFANTGNKWKGNRVREDFVELKNVKASVRVPKGRVAKSVRLLRADQPCAFEQKNGWIHFTVPRVFVHEAVAITLA